MQVLIWVRNIEKSVFFQMANDFLHEGDDTKHARIQSNLDFYRALSNDRL